MDLSSINFLAVIVSRLVAFFIGFLWYSPLFGKAWQRELGFTDEYIQQGNMVLIFGSSLVLMLVMAFGLAVILQTYGGTDMNWQQGLLHGLFVGIFFVATSYGINLLYQRRSIKLWAIDAIYQVLFLCVMGAILGGWR